MTESKTFSPSKGRDGEVPQIANSSWFPVLVSPSERQVRWSSNVLNFTGPVTYTVTNTEFAILQICRYRSRLNQIILQIEVAWVCLLYLEIWHLRSGTVTDTVPKREWNFEERRYAVAPHPCLMEIIPFVKRQESDFENDNGQASSGASAVKVLDLQMFINKRAMAQ